MMKQLRAFVGAAAILCATPVDAKPRPTAPLSREELSSALEQRDEIIAALQARVAALEAQSARIAQAQANSSPAPIVPSPTEVASTSGATRAATSNAEDDDTVKALSQTLVQRGGLVLPPWQFEVIPSAAYSNRIIQGLALVQTPEGIPTVADQRLREDEVRGAVALRLGLPGSTQIDVSVPYNWLRKSRSLGDGSSAINTGSGIGDIEVALSHQFFQEKGARPAIVAGASWRFRTGQNPFRTRVASVATGSGADQARARITAIKSVDPLVFFGTLSYSHDRPSNEAFGTVQNGDAIGLQLGTVLSLNPDTSMTFGLSQEFRGRTKLDSDPLPGTDTQSSSLQFGIGQVLSSRLLLDVSLGVGLTHDTPDYVFQISLPFRFR
jgi:Putative MetA-pathway of phenol degradation